MESVICCRVSPKLGRALPGCRTVVRKNNCRMAASRTDNSRANDRAPQPFGLLRRFGRRLYAGQAEILSRSERSTLWLLSGRICGNRVVCFEVGDALTGQLDLPFENAELIGMKSDERVSL